MALLRCGRPHLAERHVVELTPGRRAKPWRVREFLRTDHGWCRDRLDAIGYWRVEAERWTARYERVQDESIAVHQGALEAGRSEKEASDGPLTREW